MLVVMPAQPYGRLGAVLSALIVVFSLIGLTVHRDFYAGRKRRDFFCFYTNLSNLLVLIYFALLAPQLYARAPLRPLIPGTEFAVMMSIMLTFSIFHTLIFPAVRLAAGHMPHTRAYLIAAVDNVLIHYLVPWLVFFYWLLCSPGKSTLRAADALRWLLIPSSYLVFIFLRARGGRIIEETGSPYPYPFLDVRHGSAASVWRLCAGLSALCVFAGLGIIGFIRLISAFLGNGHALLLI